MAPRWSNPSGERGGRRFRVWPDGADHYNHSEHTANWDMVDAIIGVAEDGSEWPTTTGVDGGIYQEVQALQLTTLPLGMVIPWFRVSAGVPVPGAFEVCDGRTITQASHDFGAIGSITLPDMRNRFALGASAAKSIGDPAVAYDHADVSTAAGAPGPQGLGGSNTQTLTVAQMAAHTHSGSKTGWSPHGLYYGFGTPLSTADYDIVRSPVGGGSQPDSGDGGWEV